MSSSILVPLSGGQDSALVLTLAVKEFDLVTPIFFDYGQSHIEELTAAKFWASRYNLELKVIKDIQYKAYLKSIKPENYSSHTMIHRNLLFLTLAHSYCSLNAIQFIGLGVNKDDLSLHRDCNPAILRTYMQLLYESSGNAASLYTPLERYSKAEMLDLAVKENVFNELILETRTCYSKGEQTLVSYATGKGCGLCNACRLRETAFNTFLNKNAGIKEVIIHGLNGYVKNELGS